MALECFPRKGTEEEASVTDRVGGVAAGADTGDPTPARLGDF